MTTTVTPQSEVVDPPAAGESCDACSGDGKLRVILANGGELIFCGAHANVNANGLKKDGNRFGVDPDFAWQGNEPAKP